VPIQQFLRVAIALACAGAVVVSLIARDSRIATEEGFQYYLRTKDARGAFDRFEQAKRLNPDFGLDIVQSTMRPDQADRLLRGALRREPENAELWVALARYQAKRGDREAARQSYARARKLAPSFLPPNDLPPGS
jgi:predicted Zn-dependent protease